MKLNESIKMPGALHQLYMEMLEKLSGCNDGSEDRLLLAEKCVQVAADYISRLRSWVDERPFSSEEEEVFFFKRIKPRFHCQLLFYQYLYILELHVPLEHKKLRKYLKRKRRLAQQHVEENHRLYEYLLTGQSHMDSLYFTRINNARPLPADVILMDGHPDFSSPLDGRVAELLKSQMLVEYLEERLAAMRVSQGTLASAVGDAVKLVWTGTKASLYQLIYALCGSGAINNGNITLIQLAEAFGRLFNIDLKNIYRGNQEDRIKAESGDFLKYLQQVYKQDADYKDTHPKGR